MNPETAATTNIPFMNGNEVDALLRCLQQFNAPINALEWGSGNSTAFLSQRLPAGSRWLSIEHQPRWHAIVAEMIADQELSDVSLVLATPTNDYVEGSDDGDFSSFRDYILFPSKLNRRFDFILVDGRARIECMAVGWDLLSADGIMVLHDAQRVEYAQGVPSNCHFLKIINPNEFMEGPLTILFMSKSPERITELNRQLSGILSPDLTIESNCSEIQGRFLNTALFINTYYGAFLNNHYSTHPSLAHKSYAEQKASLQATCFGDSDFYSTGLKRAGWGADDLIVNCQPLQETWARENGIGRMGLVEIATEQIRRQSPDVVYLQDLNLATAEFIDAIRPHTGLIVGQIASPVPAHTNLKALDIIFSSFPHFVEQFRAMGITAYYQPLAFEPRILQLLPGPERPYPATFVGGISPHHGKGLETLQKIAELVPLDCWGYGAESLQPDSPLRARHHGEAWGLDMFAVLRKSALTLNRHIDVAEDYANNMRLFEATGCGALLITDYKDNLNDLFEIGREIVAYRSPEECAALITYYRAHPSEADAIARAGQQRTLRDHSYAKRLEQTAEILERHLRYRTQSQRFEPPGHVSEGYRAIDSNDVQDNWTAAWKDAAIPARQRWLVQQELAAMYAGVVPKQFAVLAELLRPRVTSATTVLELGCSSGYYSEILEYLLNRQIRYSGVDYSQAMIDMAREYYRRPEFVVADGRSLPFGDRQFDIVISSCVLLHVPNYPEHIAETARTAKRFIVAHRTPVCRTKPTQAFRKMAYGVETVEFCFNEGEILALFLKEGFSLISYCEISSIQDDAFSISYLFERDDRPV